MKATYPKSRKAILVTTLALLFPLYSSADTFDCFDNNGTPTCQYDGLLEFVDATSNAIAVRFLDTLTQSEIDASGYTCIGGASWQRRRGGLSVSQSTELFVDQVYATALTAVTAEKRVTIWMRNNQCVGGQPAIDEIRLQLD